MNMDYFQKLMKIIKCIEFETMQNNTHTSNTLLQKCMRMINVRFEIVVTSEEWMGDEVTEGCSVGFNCIILLKKTKSYVRYGRMLGLIS